MNSASGSRITTKAISPAKRRKSQIARRGPQTEPSQRWHRTGSRPSGETEGQGAAPTRRRPCVKAEQLRQGRRAETPRTPKPEHHRADRSQRVPIHNLQIDCPARPAARTQDVEPRRSGDQGCPDGGRPQHVAACRQAPIPAINDQLCLETRGAVRFALGGASLDVEPSCPDAHGPVSGRRAAKSI
jgi:hypothetical protein